MKINHFMPTPCMFCLENACYDELPVCCDCISFVQQLLTKRCKNCNKPPNVCDCQENKELRFLFFYGERYANWIIHKAKYKADSSDIDFFVELLFTACALNKDSYDAVAYVPRRRIDARRFGYDHAKEIAKAISRIYNIPWIRAIKRVRGKQQKLLSESERIANADGRYTVINNPNKETQYKRILLVDDVSTTGATIKTCAALLRGTVSKAVIPITLAKTDLLRR